MTTMTMVSWNVNGLRAAEKKGFLKWLDGCGADLVFVQETKALPEQLSDEMRAPKGWHARFFSAERKGYSGVGMFAREEPDEVILGCGDERFSVQGRSIAARYGKLVVWGNYFPNGGNDNVRVPYKMDYYRHFLKVMEAQRSEGLEVVVCGDLNTAHREIDLARPKQNVKKTGFLPEERAELDRWFGRGWVDSFRHVHGDVTERYSWWTLRGGARERNVGWRLDYFVTDEALAGRIKDAEIHADVMGSDHCPVSLALEL